MPPIVNGHYRGPAGEVGVGVMTSRVAWVDMSLHVLMMLCRCEPPTPRHAQALSSATSLPRHVQGPGVRFSPLWQREPSDLIPPSPGPHGAGTVVVCKAVPGLRSCHGIVRVPPLLEEAAALLKEKELADTRGDCGVMRSVDGQRGG